MPAPEFSAPAPHPQGSQAKVLLTSVFGPYALDDAYGSRLVNPMELYHNQVTRVQGPFSLRMFHRSWGLMLIQVNIAAPCALLDFPTLERFTEEIRGNHYDVIGISSIAPNLLKVRKMCKLIRRYQPHARIVVGGHIANVPDLERYVSTDHVVQGDGVQWFRAFLQEDVQQPIRHPMVSSGFDVRSAGIVYDYKPADYAATVIPAVGCPLGCNFCSTSAMFGGKGRFETFYADGDELFDVMSQLERAMQVETFFVMDENFLLQRPRTLRLLERMQQHDKAWSLYVFSSANVLRSYTMEQLVDLGVSWIWMGLEGENSQYAKLRSIDTVALIRELQSHGIGVLGSTIIGLENHTPQNIDQVIDHAVRHNVDFHQFMLYTAIPGTPLNEDLSRQGQITIDHLADVHGQLVFNYRHPHIPPGQETQYLMSAFQRDFDVNGPSILRIVRTTLAGWKRHQHHPDPRVRRRYLRECKGMTGTLPALAKAAQLYYQRNPQVQQQLSDLLDELYQEFGTAARRAAAEDAPRLLQGIHDLEQRLDAGWTCEPPTFYERNAALDRPAATLCSYVSPSTEPETVMY